LLVSSLLVDFTILRIVRIQAALHIASMNILQRSDEELHSKLTT
jgi:hypothetical protein